MNYPFRDGGHIVCARRRLRKIFRYGHGDMPKVSEMRARRRYEFPRDTRYRENTYVLGGESVEGKSNAGLAHLRMSVGERVHAVSLLLLALKIIAFLPGAFSVFYGDEVGTEGYRDPFVPPTFPVGERGYRTSRRIPTHPTRTQRRGPFLRRGFLA